jgi:hypothetical protein
MRARANLTGCAAPDLDDLLGKRDLIVDDVHAPESKVRKRTSSAIPITAIGTVFLGHSTSSPAALRRRLSVATVRAEDEFAVAT